jgi:ankyrin repeat protein
LHERGATENIFDVAYVGGEAMATQLLKQDKSLALATNAMGLSVVDIAAGTGQVEVLKHLLDSGASSERAGGFEGQTPLHLAAIYNQTNAARLLIRRGAKVNADDRSGFTPLHVAALRGATEVAGILLKAKADPNQQMSEPSGEGMPRMPMMGGPNAIRFAQDSPLHLAAVMCQTNMIRLLLASGASVNAADGMGRTPLDLAKSAGFPPSIFWIQRSLGRIDPLGVAEPLSFPNRASLTDQQKATTTLHENAGGKSRQSGPRL